MDNLAKLIIFPLIVSIIGALIGLIIEYKVFKSKDEIKQPSNYKKEKETRDTITPTHRDLSSLPSSLPLTDYYIQYSKENNSKKPEEDTEEQKPSIARSYHRVMIIIISITFGFLGGQLLRLASEDYYSPGSFDFLSIIAEMIVNSDFLFIVMLVVMIPVGILFAILVDTNPNTTNANPVLRYFLAALVSFMGSFAGCIAAPILILFLIFKYGNLK